MIMRQPIWGEEGRSRKGGRRKTKENIRIIVEPQKNQRTNQENRFSDKKYGVAQQFLIGKTLEERFFEKFTSPGGREKLEKTLPKTIPTASRLSPGADFPRDWDERGQRQSSCPARDGCHVGGANDAAP